MGKPTEIRGKMVNSWEVPEGAKKVGYRFEPYHDVTVLEKDGEYYEVWFYIGD